MLKGGLLPSPIITPLSSSPLAAKNKIHTQTFVEIRSDVSNVRIYFTVDGSKPDPFQIFRTGSMSTFLYRGAFRLGPGKRVIKAVAVTSNGLRESNVITKFLDVNDAYSEVYDESNIDYSDNDQTVTENNQSNLSFDRSQWNESFQHPTNIEGPISPHYTVAVQANLWNPPEENWIDSYGCNQYDYAREQMIQRLPPPPPPPPVIPPPPPVQQLPPPPRMMDMSYEEENFWDRKTKPLSPGNGNWKKTLEHIFLNVYNFVKDERELRELFGWKIFGRIETMRLIDKGAVYQVLTTFKKPLGEQTPYEEPPLIPLPNRKRSSKHRSKKQTKTLDTDEDRSTRHNRSFKRVDSDEEKSMPSMHSFKSPTRHETSIHEVEQQKPKIYTVDLVEQGTLIPFPDFDVKQDCEDLRKSMKHSHADEDMIIHILGNRTCDQRVKIHETFQNMFDRDIEKDLKGEDISENFRRIVKSLLLSPLENDCNELRKAIKGLSTNEEALIEILASRSNKRLQNISKLYPEKFETPLEEDIVTYTNGYFKKLLLALVKDQRPQTNLINENEVRKDAKQLFEAGENKWGSENSKFIEILCNRSDVHLKAVFETYKDFSERDIEEDIKSETSGSLRNGLLAIVGIMRNRPGFFASQLKKAFNGEETNSNDLSRIIVTRCEVDMIQIKEEYENMTKQSLEDDIKRNTSEDYQGILLELIKHPSQRNQKIERKKREKTDSSDYEQPEISDRESNEHGTMTPAKGFDAIRDADALRKAMKGAGTDEKTIIKILGNRSTIQRLEIKSAFKNKHNRDLIADLKSETSGEFRKLLEQLMLDPVEFDCTELKQAVKGAGTDEQALIEILINRNNKRIKSINDTYNRMYGRSLEKDLKSDTSGDFRRLVLLLLQGKRPESTDVDMGEAKDDARSLIDAGSHKFETERSKFNELLATRSDSQLQAIFNQFSKVAGKSIDECVKKETMGDLQRALLVIISSIQSRTHFFAEQLQKAMKGTGTKESALNRIIITRSEIDLVQIKSAYKHLFRRELERDVSADTSGDYKTLLLELLKDPSQRS